MLTSIEAPDWFAAAIAGLCTRFIRTDRDAWGWTFQFPDESDWDSSDCNIMSERVLRLAESDGFAGFLVRVASCDDDRHWFTVVTEPGDPASAVVVDWTARQFYNAGLTAVPADPALIACPLLFDWPAAVRLARTISTRDRLVRVHDVVLVIISEFIHSHECGIAWSRVPRQARRSPAVARPIPTTAIKE